MRKMLLTFLLIQVIVSLIFIFKFR